MFSISLPPILRQSLTTLTSSTSVLYTTLQSQLGIINQSPQSRPPPPPSTKDSIFFPLTPNYHPPRHPLILCHGLFGFDKLGPSSLPLLQIHYWSGVTEALSRLGAHFIVTRVPRVGGIAERARALDQTLGEVMAMKEVNLVGHSMGGLDGRYLASKVKGRNYTIRSVTTLGTPHRGSPVMDWFRDWVGVGNVKEEVKEAARKVKKERSSLKIPIPDLSLDPVLNSVVSLLDTPAYSNLTTNYLTHDFNPATPDNPDVRYFSYGASVPSGIPIYSPLGLPWHIVNAAEGENDGLVSINSARWGEYLGTVETDHWSLAGRGKLWGKGEFDVGGFFCEIVTRLWKEGY